MARPLTVYIIGYNEEANLRELLPTVEWADEILYVDSYSTDGTADLCAEFGVRHVDVRFEGFGALRNRALELASHDWMVSIDTDERSTPEFEAEVRRELAAPQFEAYLVPRKSHFLGRWMRHGGWYPDYRQPQVFNRRKMRYRDDLVHEGYELNGRLGRMQSHVLQYPWPTLDVAIGKLQRYSTLMARRYAEERRPASVVRLIGSPAAMFLKVYLVQQGFREGRHGLLLAGLYSYYTFMKYAKLWEIQLAAKQKKASGRRPDQD